MGTTGFSFLSEFSLQRHPPAFAFFLWPKEEKQGTKIDIKLIFKCLIFLKLRLRLNEQKEDYL